MRVEIKGPEVTLTREPGEPRIHSESALYYKLKLELIKQGHDVIKRLMWKDGHLVDSYQHYIRERKGKFCIWDTHYAIRNPAHEFNREGSVTLRLESLEGD